MSQYFPKSYDRFGKNVKVKYDLSNHETNADANVISSKRIGLNQFKS